MEVLVGSVDWAMCSAGWQSVDQWIDSKDKLRTVVC